MTPARRSGRAACSAAPGLCAAASGALAVAAARAAYAALRRHPPAGEKTWTRRNHRGEPVTLLEGPALAIGAITVEAGAAAIAGGGPSAVALAGAGSLAFGAIDDLLGSGKRRGLRGHLGALARGEITTGTVKLAGLTVTGLASAVLAGSARAGAGTRSVADVVINGGLIAGSANLLNLFDLRPGRAIKVAALSAGLVATASALQRGPGQRRPGQRGPADAAGLAGVAAPCGAALALLPEDLRERAMLGDAGANALGAMLGAAAAVSLPRPARAGLLAGIVALTLASEKVSFTRVIERTPALHWLDMLGRRPAVRAELPAAGTPAASHPAVFSRRRPAGRHRRVGTEASRVRSGEWMSGLLKKPARQRP